MRATFVRSALVLTFAALVEGCATAPTGNPRTFDCGDCRVKVKVTCEAVMFCHASVDIDEIRARGQNVFWEIDDTSNANFVFDPITAECVFRENEQYGRVMTDGSINLLLYPSCSHVMDITPVANSSLGQIVTYLFYKGTVGTTV